MINLHDVKVLFRAANDIKKYREYIQLNFYDVSEMLDAEEYLQKAERIIRIYSAKLGKELESKDGNEIP